MRAVIYARYSSSNQREASIDDQVRECRKYIKGQGWKNTHTYFDKALSGATNRRPGFQEILADAKKGEFDVLVAEALDRISRDQEHIAGLFKQMTFLGIRVVTLSEGEINELHVGLKGTMNALFLKDLAAKIRRGQKGRALQGRCPGSLAYGYAVVKKIGADGELEKGLRETRADAAEIVRRIFSEYVRGKSAKAIAKQLNAEGVPGPTGGAWNASSINGNKKRRDGILWNEAYVGKLVYNRQTFVKDPSTGKRIPRLNPESQWVVVDSPSLRIVSDELWDATQRIKGRYQSRVLVMRRRPQRLLSGLCKCAVCGGAYTVIGTNRMGCSTHRDRGTCNNTKTISIPQIERRVLNGLSSALRHPKFVSTYEQEFRNAFAALSSDNRQEHDHWNREVGDVDRKIETMLSVLESGERIEAVVARLKKLEEQKAHLRRQKPSKPRPAKALPKDLPGLLSSQLDDLSAALNLNDATRQEAVSILRQIFQEVRLHPREGLGNLAIEVKAYPHNAWLAAESAGPDVMLKLVAEEGLEPPTPGL